MELIKHLKCRKKGKHWTSWGLFLCPACNQEVEKPLSNGRKYKTCGCQQRKWRKPGPRKKAVNHFKNRKAREYASIHCELYNFCRDRAAYDDEEMKCYQCEFFKEKKQTSLDFIRCQYGFDETTEFKIWA